MNSPPESDQTYSRAEIWELLKAMEYLLVFDRPIAFHRVLVDVCGSVTAALMFSQAIYWSKQKEWFWKTSEEWQQETGLTQNEQQTARRNLRKGGFLEEKFVGSPPKIHFKVNMVPVFEAIKNLPSCRNVAGQPAENRQPNLPQTGMFYKEAETTSESTTQTTKSKPFPSGDFKSDFSLELSELTPPKDPRHSRFKDIWFQGYRAWNGRSPRWGPADANQLARLLRELPDIAEMEFVQLLKSRAASDEVNTAAQAMQVFPTLTQYGMGPLNKYGRPKDREIESESKDAARSRRNREAAERVRQETESPVGVRANVQQGNSGRITQALGGDFKAVFPPGT